MQATDLGRYLFYGHDADFLARRRRRRSRRPASPATTPTGPCRESGAARSRSSTSFADRALAVGDGGRSSTVAPGRRRRRPFEFVDADGCPEYPEVDINVTGGPTTGSPSYGEVAGLLDGHMHGMAYEFLGGRAHCGKPWDRFGAPVRAARLPRPRGRRRLRARCSRTSSTAIRRAATTRSAGRPSRTGPTRNSLTHEQSYWRWLERAWRGGLRVYVNLFVENRVLCEVYPLQEELLQRDGERPAARRATSAQMQDYIDAQFGGPGKGFFRIVTNPYRGPQGHQRGQARRGPGHGDLGAVRLRAESTRPDLRRSRHRLLARQAPRASACRQLEIINKFDNALTGVAGDNGTHRRRSPTPATSSPPAASGAWSPATTRPTTTTRRRPRSLPHNDDADHRQRPRLRPGRARCRSIPSGPLCNTRGLSDLGEYAIRGMIKRHMIFDPDHMSVMARNQALNLVESEDYSGIISSHSWSTATRCRGSTPSAGS